MMIILDKVFNLRLQKDIGLNMQTLRKKKFMHK